VWHSSSECMAWSALRTAAVTVLLRLTGGHVCSRCALAVRHLLAVAIRPGAGWAQGNTTDKSTACCQLPRPWHAGEWSFLSAGLTLWVVGLSGRH
jgi:hypothetical protein